MIRRLARSTALAAFLVACTEKPEPQRVIHLAERIGDASVAARDASCTIDGERLPAIGCTPWVVVRTVKVPDGVPMPPIVAPWPVTLRGQRILLQARSRRNTIAAETRHFASFILEPAEQVRVPDTALTPDDLAPGTLIDVLARQVPAPSVQTEPLDIPPGATLTMSLAFDPEVVVRHVTGVEFRVTARDARGVHAVYAETLLPPSPEHSGWRPVRVPLDAIAGTGVQLEFATTMQTRGATAAEPALAMPLWGGPLISARPPTRSAGPRPRNVVLVSFDTLRASEIGCYGHPRPTTPTMDRFAAAGAIFERTSTTFPTTTAAHMSMLTGLYPNRHKVMGPMLPLAPTVTTLAMTLAANGWRTGAVTEDAMINASCGFPRGFSSYREFHAQEDYGVVSRAVEETFAAGQAFLTDAKDQRFFLFLHTYVVHSPYSAPLEHQLFAALASQHGGVQATGDADRYGVLEKDYAAETHYADTQLAALLSHLDRLGLADDTVVIVTADHGEEFGEHGNWQHGTTLYEEVMHVPLLIRAPGLIAAGTRIAVPTSLVDIAPTVLDLLGLPVTENLDGQSQVPRLRGAPMPEDRVVYGEIITNDAKDGRRFVARNRGTKWVSAPNQTDQLEAFDLIADAAERTPVTDPTTLDIGRRLLRIYRQRDLRAAIKAPAAVDAATRAKIQALGYAD